MRLKHITIEQILYTAILILAIGVRIYQIDGVPLSDFEATSALQALQVSSVESPDFSPGPAYTMLTGLTFYLFAETNAFARIWPIIAGSCLVLFPYFIRSLIGRKAAFIMALGLALSPTLVSSSRLAGSDILAVGFAMMAIGLIVARKPIPAGIFVGLSLFSGPAAIQGILGILLAIMMGGLLSRIGMLEPLSNHISPEFDSKALISIILSILAVFIIVGTLFFLIPTGLGSITSIIPAYLQGWISFSDVRAPALLINLVIYNPITIIFGLVSIFNAWRYKDSFSQWLSIWAGAAFLLAFLYPGKDTFSWLWFLIPLWALASKEIARYFWLKDAEPLPALGQALLIFILMALGWINLAGLSTSGGQPETSQIRWAIVAGTFVLGGITTLLISLGWSQKTALQGLAWGVLIGLGFYGISLTWGLSQLRPNSALELVAVPPAAGEAVDFQETMGDLSEWRTGMRDTLDVVLTTTSPSLAWELRNWDNARFVPSIPSGVLPSVIITAEGQPEPNLSLGYRGQDFTWWVSPGWEGVLPDDWPGWLVFREAPQEVRKIILWARIDLFPGGILAEIDESSSEIIEDEIPVGKSVE